MDGLIKKSQAKEDIKAIYNQPVVKDPDSAEGQAIVVGSYRTVHNFRLSSSCADPPGAHFPASAPGSSAGPQSLAQLHAKRHQPIPVTTHARAQDIPSAGTGLDIDSTSSLVETHMLGPNGSSPIYHTVSPESGLVSHMHRAPVEESQEKEMLNTWRLGLFADMPSKHVMSHVYQVLKVLLCLFLFAPQLEFAPLSFLLFLHCSRLFICT